MISKQSVSSKSQCDDDGNKNLNEVEVLLKFMSIFHLPLQNLLQSLSSLEANHEHEHRKLQQLIVLFKEFINLLQDEFRSIRDLFIDGLLPPGKRIELLQYLTLPSIILLDTCGKWNQIDRAKTNITLSQNSYFYACINLALESMHIVFSNVENDIPTEVLVRCLVQCLKGLPEFSEKTSSNTVLQSQTNVSSLDEDYPHCSSILGLVVTILKYLSNVKYDLDEAVAARIVLSVLDFNEISILLTILNIYPSLPWNKFLPGCFSSLYKQIDRSEGIRSRKVVDAIDAMTILLRLTVVVNAEKDEQTANDVSSVAAALFKNIDRREKLHHESNAPNCNMCDNEVMTARLTQPLLNLLSGLMYDRFDKIGIKSKPIARLCNVILSSNLGDEVKTRAFECLVTRKVPPSTVPPCINLTVMIVKYFKELPALAYSQKEEPLLKAMQFISCCCDIVSNVQPNKNFGRTITNEGTLNIVIQSLRVLVSIDMISSQNKVYSLRDSLKLKFLPTLALQRCAFSMIKSFACCIGFLIKDLIGACIDIFEHEINTLSPEYIIEPDLDACLQVSLYNQSNMTALLNLLFVASIENSLFNSEYILPIFDSLVASISNTENIKIASAVFQSQQLQLMTSLAIGIGDTAMHQVIFPLMRKTSPKYHPIVRDVSKLLLKSLVDKSTIPFCSSEWLDCVDKSLKETSDYSVLYQYRESVVDGIIVSLKEDLSIDCVYVTDQCIKRWWVSDEDGKKLEFNENFLLVELIQSLLFAYDRDQCQSRMMYLAVLCVFESTFEAAMSLFDLNHDDPTTNDADLCLFSWKRKLLYEFGENWFTNESETPEEWFGHHHKTEQLGSECDTYNDEYRNDPAIFSFCNSILYRSTFYLSSNDLIVQCRACRVIKRGFVILSSIVQNPSSNYLLRSINEHWPVIISKADACSSALCTAYSCSHQASIIVHRLSRESETNIGATTSFLIELLELISFIHEQASDFMASRFQENVWPILAKILGNHLKLQSVLKDKNDNANVPLIESSHQTILSSSEAALSCIARVCSVRKCGSILVNLLPVIARVCIPFLSIKGKVGEAAVNALKSILLLDNCCVYRDLAMLANKQLPRNPFLAERNGRHLSRPIMKIIVKTTNEGSLLAASRALLLLDFIDQMEEYDMT